MISGMAPGDPDPHVLEPDYAPTPFTAEEIRARSTRGRVKHVRVESENEPTFVRIIKFVECDDEGATVERAQLAEDGTTAGPIVRERVTWLGLQAHASFPAERAEIVREQIETPLGVLDCLRYTVTDGGDVNTFWFAKDLPGMPVRYTAAVGGHVVSTTTVILDTLVTD